MSMVHQILLVGFGGFIGSVLRYICNLGINRLWPALNLPLGTLTVNIIGCFMIGFLGGLGGHKQVFVEPGRLFIITGILGGFTTFSAFGLETFHLMRDCEWFLAVGNVLLQVLVGLLAVALGHWLSEFI